MEIDKFNNIIVLGMGKSGLSSVRLLKHLGKNVTAINQGEVNQWAENDILSNLSSDKKISQSDERAREAVNKCDLVILSPGIPRDIDLLKNIEAPIWSEIELGWQFCDSPVIGVTGTNGKTTTVSFLQECLKHENKPYFVGGNIGTPLCDYAFEYLTKKREKAWVILLELSSFQLESTFSFCPEIGAVLNITFSHGERYSELKDYACAKRNLFNQMEEGTGIWPVGMWEELNLAKPLTKSSQEIDLNNLDSIKMELQKVINLDELKIYGVHNLYNLLFAKRIWEAISGDEQSFKKASQSFGGVEFRLEFLGEWNGLKVFNDAKSTNWEATLTAINGVKDQGEITLVLGGQKRGEGDSRIEVLSPVKKSIKKIYLIGESGKDLLAILKDEYSCEYVETLENLKRELIKSEKDGVLLFSPGFPSFDQFKNYIERGRAFTSLFNNN